MVDEYSNKIKECETGTAGIADYWAENIFDLIYDYIKGLSKDTQTIGGSAIVDRNSGQLLSLGHDWGALPSAVNAIASAAKKGLSTKSAVIYITECPDMVSARAIISAGINVVIYGGQQLMLEIVQDILLDSNVRYYHLQWNIPSATN